MSRRLLWVLVLGAAAILADLLLVASRATPTPTPTPAIAPAPARSTSTTLAGTPFDIVPVGDVGSTRRASVAAGLRTLDGFVRDLGFGWRPGRHVLVSPTLTDKCLIPRRGRVDGSYLRGVICLYLGVAGGARTPGAIARLAAHEAVHALQDELDCLDGPRWLIEGTAEVVSGQAVRRARIVVGRDPRARWPLRLAPANAGLDYAAARTAAHMLSGASSRRLLAACVDAPRLGWGAAFRRRFGTTPTRFYVQLARIGARRSDEGVAG